MLFYRYLTEEIYKKPVIVYNYPKDIKAFYMRLNDDGKTVAAMDVLVPKVSWLPLTFYVLCDLFKTLVEYSRRTVELHFFDLMK